MSILSARDLSLAFGARDVFSGLSFEVPNDAKIGLIGPNGVGKTSMFGIIAGVAQPSSGSVHLARGARIGYLRQEAVEAFTGHDHSVYDEMLTVFAPLRRQADALRDIEARMSAGDTSADLLLEYGAVQEAFERTGGYEYDVRIQQTLDGLGFGRYLWSTAMTHLSGGQKTRALLARLLLEQPTLLILDEPTNHLDVAAIEWLEKTLRTWSGALLIASHDRYFLDQVVDRIWEMGPHHIDTYRGNYSAYAVQREERWEANLTVFESERERLARELELVRRYIAWRKFDEAWGKLKRLSRELMAVQRYGILGMQGKRWSELDIHKAKMMTIEEAHEIIKGIKPPVGRPPRVHLKLRSTRRSGEIVLRTHGLEVGYEGRALVRCDDVVLERLERVALIGPNGSGKTTILKTLLGDLPAVGGDIRPGAGLHVGYFSQAHDTLHRENSVLDELLRHRNLPIPEARNYLAQFLFRGDDVYKEIASLSGGERGRLALAVLALDGVNFLLLDEPTNHLDIAAREVLQEGLEAFEGTILLVTHDRYLVSELATQIWEIADGRMRVFKGTYAQQRDERDAVAPVSNQTRRAPGGREDEYRARDKRQRARILAGLEEQIGKAEAALAGHTARLEACDDSSGPEEIKVIADEYAAAQEELERLFERWSSVAG